MQKLEKLLKRWFDNISSKSPVTMEAIYTMYEGREEQINWDKVPPQVDDFPTDVQKAILCYGKFPDIIVPDIGFLGKDFGMFELIKRTEFVIDESLFLETLLQLNCLYIQKSQRDMEVARKNANHGKK